MTPLSSRSRPLRRRLALIGGVLLTGLIWGLVALDITRTYRGAVAAANHTLDNVESLIEAHVGRSIDSGDALLRSAIEAVAPALTAGDPPRDAIAALLRSRLPQIEHIRALLVVAADGRNAGDTTGLPPPPSLADRDYFRVHRDADRDLGLVLGQPGVSVTTQRWYVTLSRRIDAADGTFLGVAVAFLEPAYFNATYNLLQLGEHGVVSLYRRDGVMLFRNFQPLQFIGRSFANRPLFTELLPRAPRGRHWVPGGIDGIDRLVSYRTVTGYPLVVTIGLAQSEILGSWREHSLYLLLAATAVSLAIGAFVFLLARAICRQQKLVIALATATERANTANRMKSEFLANMSHELRTPLNAVIGFAEVLKATAAGPLNAKQIEYIGDIEAAGRHLLAVISDVLSFAKIEAGRVRLDEEVIDLRALIEESRRLSLPAAQRAGVTLRHRCEGSGPAYLRADKRMVKQMLLNLESNAIKFTPQGGQVETICTADEGGLVVAVSDTGIGIPPDQREKVLEPFIQVSNGFTRTRDGTGLGLSIVKSLIELHGGRLEIHSVVGAGTTVRLCFPADRTVHWAADAVA